MILLLVPSVTSIILLFDASSNASLKIPYPTFDRPISSTDADEPTSSTDSPLPYLWIFDRCVGGDFVLEV